LQPFARRARHTRYTDQLMPGIDQALHQGIADLT
jgi:hypothetical protein